MDYAMFGLFRLFEVYVYVGSAILSVGNLSFVVFVGSILIIFFRNSYVSS